MAKMIERPSGLGAQTTPEFEEQHKRWESASEKGKPREGPGSGAVDRTISDVPLKTIYGPEDTAHLDLARDLAWPGEYPYTRGIHPNGYRDRLWTMRQFAGFGNAKQTNERYHFLLAQGQHGLSVAFDMPTLMGYDSDQPQALGEVGKCGVAIDSLRDMEVLFDGIDMGDITTSMTINGPAAIALAQYIAAAEKKGMPRAKLGGTHSGRHPQRIHRAERVDLSAASAHAHHRRHDRVLHGRDAEVEHDLDLRLSHSRSRLDRRARARVHAGRRLRVRRSGIAAGMDVDSFAPRLSFFFNSHIDFFEEIAKFRAARRIYARHMREKYGAKDPRSWKLRFHTQTAGCSATAQQPENNIVRVAYEAMAAVLGGTQSLHTNSMDEVLALPTEKSVEIALRTQQVLAYETNVTNVVDPLGGSYYVEALTDEMERQAEDYFAQIDEFGGVIEAIEAGLLPKEIADASLSLSAFARSQRAHRRRRQRVRARGRDRRHRSAEDRRRDGTRASACRAGRARAPRRERRRGDARRLQQACRDPRTT